MTRWEARFALLASLLAGGLGAATLGASGWIADAGRTEYPAKYLKKLEPEK